MLLFLLFFLTLPSCLNGARARTHMHARTHARTHTHTHTHTCTHTHTTHVKLIKHFYIQETPLVLVVLLFHLIREILLVQLAPVLYSNYDMQ